MLGARLDEFHVQPVLGLIPVQRIQVRRPREPGSSLGLLGTSQVVREGRPLGRRGDVIRLAVVGVEHLGELIGDLGGGEVSGTYEGQPVLDSKPAVGSTAGLLRSLPDSVSATTEDRRAWITSWPPSDSGQSAQTSPQKPNSAQLALFQNLSGPLLQQVPVLHARCNHLQQQSDGHNPRRSDFPEHCPQYVSGILKMNTLLQ